MGLNLGNSVTHYSVHLFMSIQPLAEGNAS